MTQTKRALHVTYRGQTTKVGFYEGTSDAAMERAIQRALGLADEVQLRFRDADGDIVALSAALPSGVQLAAELAPTGSPASTSSADSGTGAVIGKPAQSGEVSDATSTLPEVPGPRAWPFIGNAAALFAGENLEDSLAKVAAEYGRFVRLRLPNGNVFYVNSDADLVEEQVNRPEDFRKTTPPPATPLGRLRAGVGSSGLFTTGDEEEIWQIAHRILLPAFGLSAIKQYFGRIVEVSDDLMQNLAGRAATESFLATELMTKMTFEAIGYAGFHSRFHCISAAEPPPFVQAMVDVLEVAMEQTRNFLPDTFHPLQRHKKESAQKVLIDTVDQIIIDRKAAMQRGEAVPSDILQIMLTARDRQTGKRLPDDNIRAQLITFLIAGHETTSGMLSYALYYISKNPHIEAQLIAEVDRVLGRDFSRVPTFADLDALDYTGRILKESLRLNPTAPGFAKFVQRDTVIGGKYPVKKGGVLLTFLGGLHRDPRHFGPDPETFNPDHFLPDAVAQRHPHAYHPFGIGIRSCIGFQFALVEAKLVLARIYQQFRLRLADPSYQLRSVQTLTMKPRGLYMVVEKRTEEKGKLPLSLTSQQQQHEPPQSSVQSGSQGILILYGSNMGTAQDLAQKLLQQASARKIPATVAELDSYAQALPKQTPVFVFCSTYNGQPPDNASKFAAWLSQDLPHDTLAGVEFAVLGCGNKQWRATFQKVPQLLFDRMQALGAKALLPFAGCDADGDFDASAESFFGSVWSLLSARSPAGKRGAAAAATEDTQNAYSVEVVNYAGSESGALPPSRAPLQAEARYSTVIVSRELQAEDSGRSTRHLEIALPDGVSYSAGDHLGVFPENPPEVIEAYAARCGVRSNDAVVIRELGAVSGQLPCGIPIRVGELLGLHVDLSGAVTRRELRVLAARCPCPPEQQELLRLAGEKTFPTEVLAQRLTLLDLLQRFASIPCDLATILTLRPTLRCRYYSISSSPKKLPRSCSITVGVHDFVGPQGVVREGLCSHYLAQAEPGQTLRIIVKDTGSTFRLPSDPKTPVILIGPGTGLAPLRGFIDERAAQKEQGIPVGKTLLFFGCRRPDHDYLYREELESHARNGGLDGLYVAFSRQPDQPKTYVQDLLRRQAKELWSLLQAGAYVYLCGDARHMAPAVRKTLHGILISEGGYTPEQAEEQIHTWRTQGRYCEDVWAAT
jgi:cytochrome P450/NADPH-cytochrome P450 reductase